MQSKLKPIKDVIAQAKLGSVAEHGKTKTTVDSGRTQKSERPKQSRRNASTT